MEENEKPVEPQVGEYKGHPLLTLNPGARYPFSFGVGKAKLIMENLEAIKKFIEDHDK